MRSLQSYQTICGLDWHSSHTIYSLLASEGLPLLCLVPFYDESVSEGERGARICGTAVCQRLGETFEDVRFASQLIAVEQRPS